MAKMKMNESEKDIAKLKAENDALKDRLTKLENQIDPPPRPRSNYAPHDYTQGFSMPASALKAMVNAVPESVIRGIVADSFKPNPVTGGAPQPQPQPVQRGSGGAKSIPVEPPPGINLMDQMMDAQDAQDRTELARKIAQARLAEEK